MQNGLDLEVGLISHLTNVDNIKYVYEEGLKSVTFVNPVNKAIFENVIQYWIDNSMQLAPTIKVIEHEFPSFIFNEPEESLNWLTAQLKKRYVRNQVQDTVRSAAKIAGENPEEALNEMFQASANVISNTSPRRSRSNLAENLEDRRQRYDDRHAFTGSVRGIPMGLDLVDNHTFGLLPGELGVAVGYAKTGKSQMLGWIAKSARESGYTPILFTLELAVPEFEDRLDAAFSGLSMEKIGKGTLDRDEVKILRESQERMKELGPLYLEKPPRGEASVKHLVSRARQVGADVIIIDQLSFIESQRSFGEKRDAFSEIMFDLKRDISDSRTTQIPCFIAAQFNREAAKLGIKKRGQMHHIGVSSAIEQTADIIYGLTQTPEMRLNKSLVMDIMAFRRGAPKSYLLEWSLSDRTHIGVRKEEEIDQ